MNPRHDMALFASGKNRRQQWRGRAFLSTALVAVLVLSSPAAAHRSTTHTETIARILVDFVHVATPSQREALGEVIDDPAATAADCIIAKALLRVLHVAHPDDIGALRMIAADPSQPPLVSVMAHTMLSLEHVPTPMQKAALRNHIAGP